jgi:hypothetical protein
MRPLGFQSDERARVLCSLLFCLSSAIDEYFYAEHNFGKLHSFQDLLILLSHSDSTSHCTPFYLATNFVCLNPIWFTSDSLCSADLSQLHNRRPHTRHRGRIHKAPPVAIHNLHVHHWVIACTTVCMQRTLKA